MLKKLANPFGNWANVADLTKTFIVTIYKPFIRPHLDYGGIIFDRAFHDNLESIQCNASLKINGGITGTSRKKTLSGVRFRISLTKALVSQTEHFLQDMQKSISALYLQLNTPANQLARHKIIQQNTLVSHKPNIT